MGDHNQARRIHGLQHVGINVEIPVDQHVGRRIAHAEPRAEGSEDLTAIRSTHELEQQHGVNAVAGLTARRIDFVCTQATVPDSIR